LAALAEPVDEDRCALFRAGVDLGDVIEMVDHCAKSDGVRVAARRPPSAHCAGGAARIHEVSKCFFPD
jgi:hypothetical protein